jgi:hypothetical protein
VRLFSAKLLLVMGLCSMLWIVDKLIRITVGTNFVRRRPNSRTQLVSATLSSADPLWRTKGLHSGSYLFGQYVNFLIRALLSAFAKLRKATISFVISVCLSVSPHGTTGLPLDGF